MNTIIQNTVKFAVSTLLATLATMAIVSGINQAAMTDLNGVSFATAAATLPAQAPLA
jgi:hypothetical protein